MESLLSVLSHSSESGQPDATWKQRTTLEGVNKLGRDHDLHGFSMWLAGVGTRGGQAIGATDELGIAAVDEPCHVSDLHATILHLMDLDHERLTFFYKGLEERITGTRGTVVKKTIA